MNVIQEWVFELDGQQYTVQIEYVMFNIKIYVNNAPIESKRKVASTGTAEVFQIGDHEVDIRPKSIFATKWKAVYKLTIDGQVQEPVPIPGVQVSILQRAMWIVVAAIFFMLAFGVAAAFEIRIVALIPAGIAFYALNKAARGFLF